MRRKHKNVQGVVRGGGRALVLSILIHMALFFVAGALVVFTVHKTKETAFEPPKAAERPKMKLKKPKVKVNKASKPKSTARIMSKSTRVSMPSIDLPAMDGIGNSLGDGGAGGFDLMPDLEEITSFGTGRSIGNDLEGAFYDLKRSPTGSLIPYSRSGFEEVVRRFIKKDFDKKVLAPYYRTPKKLYTTTLMVPPMLSSMGPLAFGEPDIPGCTFLIHYEGEIVYPEDITFRFRGSSGDVLFVGIDRKPVLNACWNPDEAEYCSWYVGKGPDHRKHMLGLKTGAVGEWITLKAGEPRRIDILMGENPGGGMLAMLVVEEQGVEYERNSYGAPILPMFKTAEPSRDLMDAIYANLPVGEVCLTNGPVFSDYNTRTRTAVAKSKTPEPMPAPEPVEDPMRKWLLTTGDTIEAEYVTTIAGKAVMKSAGGNVSRVALTQFNPEDVEYIELHSPPDFSLDFSKKVNTHDALDPGPFVSWIPPTLADITFAARVKQSSVGLYSHEVWIEYFGLGEEVAGDRYILLDRRRGSFTPGPENNRSFTLAGDPVLAYAYTDIYGEMRGTKYGGYLITVTDARGKIIAHRASHKWIYEHLDKLKELAPGNYMDKTCSRVFPTRPKLQY